jgi:hypothetical protein
MIAFIVGQLMILAFAVAFGGAVGLVIYLVALIAGTSMALEIIARQIDREGT